MLVTQRLSLVALAYFVLVKASHRVTRKNKIKSISAIWDQFGCHSQFLLHSCAFLRSVSSCIWAPGAQTDPRDLQRGWGRRSGHLCCCFHGRARVTARTPAPSTAEALQWDFGKANATGQPLLRPGQHPAKVRCRRLKCHPRTQRGHSHGWPSFARGGTLL